MIWWEKKLAPQPSLIFHSLNPFAPLIPLLSWPLSSFHLRSVLWDLSFLFFYLGPCFPEIASYIGCSSTSEIVIISNWAGCAIRRLFSVEVEEWDGFMSRDGGTLQHGWQSIKMSELLLLQIFIIIHLLVGLLSLAPRAQFINRAAKAPSSSSQRPQARPTPFLVHPRWLALDTKFGNNFFHFRFK